MRRGKGTNGQVYVFVAEREREREWGGQNVAAILDF